jgi:hypothetical protein
MVDVVCLQITAPNLCGNIDFWGGKKNCESLIIKEMTL